MADRWNLEVHLPRAGLQFPVNKPNAIAEPMGKRGARIKWPASTRREIRVSVEDTVYDASLGSLLQAGVSFGLDIVANGEFDDGVGSLTVHRQPDPRRHVLVASRPLGDDRLVQVSMEAGTDGAEVADEWAMLEGLYEAIDGGDGDDDGPVIALSAASEEHRIRFELPADTYIAQWAYGMAQLRRRGVPELGRMAFGALAAEDVDACEAALTAVATDDGVADGEVWIDDDTAVISARLTDNRGVESSLLAGARPLGRGVAVVLATLFLDGDDEGAVEDILSHAATTATTFGRARKPRASADAVAVLERMDSFRHRVAG